ncbi:hypothetical protein HMPREF1486_03146 [Streptomyces sp. HPH0547]|uniref:hypothetical protein n=1 Tax=Streptomyces sp. HPH0547 TaxID=1203592 RepID=UPI00034E47E4|nr:hypothetical protein [Streptomyces sp. HPH0547]EPD94593.1 hypothetical protein HMPREF1486_03146 [Streptomyces sp. HPH0547]
MASDYVKVSYPPPTNYRIAFRDGDICTVHGVFGIELRHDWLTLADEDMRVVFSAPREVVLYYEGVDGRG